MHAYDKENKNATQVTPYTHFKTQVRKDGGPWQDASSFFHMDHEPGLENWNFTWVDSIDARFGSDPGVDVAVSSRIWRKLKFDSPGVYDVSVTYGKKNAYTVRYTVPEVSSESIYIHIVIIITYIPIVVCSLKNQRKRQRMLSCLFQMVPMLELVVIFLSHRPISLCTFPNQAILSSFDI